MRMLVPMTCLGSSWIGSFTVYGRAAPINEVSDTIDSKETVLAIEASSRLSHCGVKFVKNTTSLDF